MSRKVVRRTGEYLILQRRDNRYAVLGRHRQPVNGDEKAEILLKEGLITLTPAATPDAATGDGSEAPAAEEAGGSEAGGE